MCSFILRCACAVLLSCVVLVAFSFSAKTAGSSTQTVTLSFAERVAYQRAIEEVYWRHRIWPKENAMPKPSLNDVMSQAQIETKVQDYLRNSQSLADYWQRPIRPDQLQAEMDRMAEHTKQPEVLQELFEALRSDPFLIAECLARPAVAQQTPERTAFEQTKQASRIITPITAPTAGYRLPIISGASGGCIDDSWAATITTNAPSSRGDHTAVWTGSEMIVWGGYPDLNTGGKYNPATDTWAAISITNAPSGRYYHTAVWTGREMIIWGGSGNSPGNLNTGGRYNPAADSWLATSMVNAPSGRTNHTAIWTGSEMIVWGGTTGFPNFLNSGGRYNPSINSWRTTSTVNAPEARDHHTAVWAGGEMIVWGGESQLVGNLDTGGRYDPLSNTWISTSTANVPLGRLFHTAVWTGSNMIVWGGTYGEGALNTGGKYDPSTNSWTPTATSNTPTGRLSHTAVWTGSEMIVWGGGVGNTSFHYFKTGSRYNPLSDSWSPTNATNAPIARSGHTAVWTGDEMIVWGGGNDTRDFNTGGKYCVAAPATLSNISTRAFVQTGDNVMIGGFIVQGTGPKRVIIRAIGPELTQYGVPNALANPRLELHNAAGALIGSNDDWQHTIIGGVITGNQVADIQNSGHAPTNPSESAIIADLPPGNYTAIVRGVNNTAGVGLVEVYDLSSATASILTNLSTRSFVQTGDNVMIGGFIVQGTGAKRIIIRAIGPELSQYGVPDPLANPRLELHNRAGALIGSNDDWQHTVIGGVITGNQVADIQNSGHSPADPMESAIVADLPAGNYSAIVRGVNNTTGVALVEVYDLDR